jgi:hypothetical protein
VNTELHIKDGGWQCVDWINLAEDKDIWLAVVKKLWYPQNDGNCLSSLGSLNSPRRTLPCRVLSVWFCLVFSHWLVGWLVGWLVTAAKSLKKKK